VCLGAQGYPVVVVTESSAAIESILDPTKYSTFSKLIGVTARVLRAVQEFKNLVSKDNNPARRVTDT
jgi:hypothetical protein